MLITYILISLISASVGTIIGAVICGLLYASKTCDEVEQFIRERNYVEQVLYGNKVDAEIAYLECLYGINDHVRTRDERN